MSNAIGNGCLVHYNDQHIQVRKDLFDLCTYDKADFNQGLSKNGKKVIDEPNQACMAMVLRLLETLSNRNNEAWITLSYSTIAALLYHTYSESTVRKSIAALLAKGYIQCRQDAKGCIPSYALNIPVIQAALDQQRKEYIQKGVNVDRGSVNLDRGSVNLDSLGVSNLTPYKKEDKITHKILYERKNDAPQQTAEKQESHPSIPSEKMDDKISSLSPDEPKEKVTLTEEGQRIYDFAGPILFEADPPEITSKIKGECEKLAKHIKTLEQFQSLLQYVRAKLKAPYHLKNMVNALNEWLQTQKVVEIAVGSMQSSSPKQTTNLLELYQMIENERSAS